MQQFVRFLIVGVTATAIHYAILIGLVQGGLAAPVVATSVGFSVSVLFNYLLNRRFTFRSTIDHGEALPRFVVVALVGLLINGSVMWLFSVPIHLPYLAAQILATGCTLFWNFTAHRLWTFRTLSA